MKLVTCILLFMAVLDVANAKIVQILHTNDIHSFFEHTDYDPEAGGYGQIRSLVDRYKSLGKEKDIETLVMDAGDFMEGNLFYMAKFGQRSFELHEKAGFDVVAMGNHDYLMGTEDLDNLLEVANPKFSYLAANLKVDNKYSAVKKHVKPYAEFKVGDIKVGVVGLTTADIIYSWRIKDGKITNPISAAKKYARLLKRRGNDIVIALTHLGLKKDKELARKVEDIDLIVGGHSHHALHEPVMVKHYRPKRGPRGRKRYIKDIPIVQAGYHGEWLGRLLLDIDVKKQHQKISVHLSELVPVRSMDRDEEVEHLVESSKNDLYELYGENWLNEIVGFSNLPPVTKENKESLYVWNFFLSDTLRDSVGADVGFHVRSLSGSYVPTEEVTRQKILNSYPRVFEFDNYYGWNVYTAEVKGYLLKAVTNMVMEFGLPVYVSGITYKYKRKGPEKYDVWDFRINGEKIKNFKSYKIAFPEGIIRGAKEIKQFKKLANLIMTDKSKTPVLIWEAIEGRLRNMGGFIDDSYLVDIPFRKSLDSYRSLPSRDRVYVPGEER